MQDQQPLHTSAPTPPAPIQPAPQTQQGTMPPQLPMTSPLTSHGSLPARVVNPPRVGRPPGTTQNAGFATHQQPPLPRQAMSPPPPPPLPRPGSLLPAQQPIIQPLTQSASAVPMTAQQPPPQIRTLPLQTAGAGARPQTITQRSQTSQPRPIVAQLQSGPTSPQFSDNRVNTSMPNGNVTAIQPQRPPPFGPFVPPIRPSGPPIQNQSNSRLSQQQTLQLAPQSSQAHSGTNPSQAPPVSSTSHPANLHRNPPGNASSSGIQSSPVLPAPSIPHSLPVSHNVQNSQQMGQNSQSVANRTLSPPISRAQLSHPTTPQRQTHVSSSPQQHSLSSPSDSQKAIAAAKVLEWTASQSMQYIKQEPYDISDSGLIPQYPEVEYEAEDEMMDAEGPRLKDYMSDDESDSKDQEIGFTPHNRGNKLKRRAEALNGGPRLKAPYGYHEDLEHVIGPSGKRRHIIYRYPLKIDRLMEYSGDEEDNPYKEIIIKDILGPVEAPEDIVRRPALKRVMKDQRLNKLSAQFMQMIEDEHSFHKILTRLYNVLQGDDPMYQNVDFRINPLPETVSTRVSRTEKSEGGSGFGVLNMGLQGNESIKGKRVLEGKDEGLETLREIREKLLEQLDCSNQYIQMMQNSRDGIMNAVIHKDKLYQRMKEHDRAMREANEPNAASSSSNTNESYQAAVNSSAGTSAHTRGQRKGKGVKGKGRAKT